MMQQEIFHDTLAMILAEMNITMHSIHFPHKQHYTQADYEAVIRGTAQASRFRVQKLKLSGHWWKADNGPLLGFYKNEPCALFSKDGTYRIISLSQGIDLIIHNEHQPLLDELSENVFCFFPSFIEQSKHALSIVKLAWPIVKKDFGLIVTTLFLIMIFNLLFSIGTGMLIEKGVAFTDADMFQQVFVGLIVVSAATIMVRISQMIITVRFSLKLADNMMTPFWDRLLRLPMKFFFKHSNANTQMRMNAVTILQDYINYAVFISFLEGVFSFFGLFVLAYFNPIIAVTALFVTAIYATIIFIINAKLLNILHRQIPCKNGIYHMIIQMIQGFEKIKCTASEHKTFARWFSLFNQQLTLEREELACYQYLDVFMKLMEILGIGLLLLFAVIMGDTMSITNFMVISSAFLYFLYGMLNIFQSSSELLEMLPYLRQIVPVLKIETEDEHPKNAPGMLEGYIELNNVNFRYERAQLPILHRINIDISPGECIAIVGESGSGKSTLLKILLGFLKPEEGEVAYDGINLNHLNILEVRSQIGTITQSAKLVPGTILDNIIVGLPHFTREDVMCIIRDLGFEDMIQKFPMGLDTPVGTGISNFSGGEVQLIQLASLFARKPSIIFLDEATSALDSETQKKVQRFLKSYKNTQFVVAHRLSTIRSADRIYMMHKGKIVEEGTFDSLIKKNGYFNALISASLF